MRHRSDAGGAGVTGTVVMSDRLIAWWSAWDSAMRSSHAFPQEVLLDDMRWEMALPEQDGRAVPKIEIDLSRIQQLSEESEDENWKFRSWLKSYAPRDIDKLVKSLSQKYFALIDCKQCANCCRSLQLELTGPELHTIAKTLGQSIEAFEKQSMSEGKVNSPCPMLSGKLCSIYGDRPDVCRSYPHLEKRGFVFRLLGVIENLSICPIAFNAFEELKTTLRWS
jgi:uncharacterized protein